MAVLETDKIFAGSVPENYDRHMVPLIFAPFADDLARRIAALAPGAVLETAAGTGVLTRALAPRLPPGARYVATDLNQPMLDFAAARQGPDPRIAWRQADALALPFDDASFDVVCCQFGAMFFPDRIAAYREARRVLRPGGHFIFNVWDRIEENAFADTVTAALATLFPDDPPRFMARTPHGYHDTALIRSELAAAGFSTVAIETRAAVSRADSPRGPAIAYCQGTLLRNEIEARDAGKLEAATERAASLIAERHGTGAVAGKIQAHIIDAGV
jgi:ubiquinone/menaquinone biosynthesis C-methylase UbiE